MPTFTDCSQRYLLHSLVVDKKILGLQIMVVTQNIFVEYLPHTFYTCCQATFSSWHFIFSVCCQKEYLPQTYSGCCQNTFEHMLLPKTQFVVVAKNTFDHVIQLLPKRYLPHIFFSCCQGTFCIFALYIFCLLPKRILPSNILWLLPRILA